MILSGVFRFLVMKLLRNCLISMGGFWVVVGGNCFWFGFGLWRVMGRFWLMVRFLWIILDGFMIVRVLFGCFMLLVVWINIMFGYVWKEVVL